jgi:hypothetical protein
VDVGIRKIIALSVGALSLTALAACGSLQTAAVSSTPNAAQATATAFFNNVNTKRALSSEPTFAPGTDPSHPLTSATTQQEGESSPDLSPTPLAPTCGATIGGWPEIVASYGTFYKGNGCGPYHTSTGIQLMISTDGINGGPGAIATYTCAPSDQSCAQGGAPTQPGASWSVYPAPFSGGVEILAPSGSPDSLLLAGGHYCFSLDTHAYNTGCY